SAGTCRLRPRRSCSPASLGSSSSASFLEPQDRCRPAGASGPSGPPSAGLPPGVGRCGPRHPRWVNEAEVSVMAASNRTTNPENDPLFRFLVLAMAAILAVMLGFDAFGGGRSPAAATDTGSSSPPTSGMPGMGNQGGSMTAAQM